MAACRIDRRIGKFRKAVLMSAALIVSAITLSDTSYAADHKTCQEYANLANAQQADNQYRGCKYAGRQWQVSTQYHYNWCRQRSPEIVKRHRNIRAEALAKCGTGGDAKKCHYYATDWEHAQRINREENCGYDHWSGTYTDHFDWCRNASAAQISKRNRVRAQALRECGDIEAKRKAVCDSYARSAVNRQNQNLRYQCGFSGQRWSLDQKAHRDWCLNTTSIMDVQKLGAGGDEIGVPKTPVGIEVDKRRRAIKKCLAERDRGGVIEVITATYGWNCLDHKPPEKYRPNSVSEDNALGHITGKCNSKGICEYEIYHRNFGRDPAYGCAKDFRAKYRCYPNTTVYPVYVPGEAGWGKDNPGLRKTVKLTCDITDVE